MINERREQDMVSPHAVRPINGVNVDDLQKTVEDIKSNSDLSKSTFRVKNRWVDGCHNRTVVDGYSVGGKEFLHFRPFTLEADEPRTFGGDECAPSPLHHLLNALATCLTTSMVAHAAMKGIEIESLESELEGEIDFQGFLGMDNARKGFSKINVSFKVKTSEKNLDKLKQLAGFSPVCDIISKGTDVEIEVVKL
jgi:uncharacterized OsmC-like protein